MTDDSSNQKLESLAAAVEQRAASLTTEQPLPDLEPSFIKQCLDSNERGDAVLYASLHQGRYLYNVTPKDGAWYTWNGHVWQEDKFRHSMGAVEECALYYQAQADALEQEIEEKGLWDAKKDHEDHWKLSLYQKYKKRIERLRGREGMLKTRDLAPVVEPGMAVEESRFDQHPDLLPAANGVVDLRTGALVSGRPDDLLTRALAIEYDPHADYTAWQEFIDEISGGPEVAGLIKRSLGCATTGHAWEQYIWVFTGPGRNGKGVLFDLVGDVLGPYYHEISRAMILEQRNEPGPQAASEHKYSLMGKRLIIGAETNKGQKIDAGAVKSLTGDDNIACRPLYRSEVVFKPTHNLFLHTNHIPIGLTRDFALLQRLIVIDLPWIFVDDPEGEARKYPARAGKFRKKKPTLKADLRKIKPGILRWLVEGAREWYEQGLSPPAQVQDTLKDLADEEDWAARFLRDCLVYEPDAPLDPQHRITTKEAYNAFRWWWSGNMDDVEKRCPHIKTLIAELRLKGHHIETTGGKTWLYRHYINPDISQEVQEWEQKHS